MHNYRLIIRSLLNILDPAAHRRGLIIASLATLQSLMDGFGLGVVLVAMRISLDPSILNRSPAAQNLVTSLGLQNRGSMTIALFAAAAAFYIVKAAFGIYVGWLTKEFAWSERDRLTERVIRNFMQWDYWRFFDFSAAALQKNVSAVEHVAKYLLLPAIMLFSELAALFVIAITLVLIQPLLMAGVLLLAATGVATAYAARRYTNKRESAFQQTIARLLAVTNEIFGSVRDIKLYGVPQYFICRVNEQVIDNSDIQKRVTFAIELPRIVLETVLVLALCGTMIAMVISGGNLTAALPFTATLVVAMVRLLPAANRILLALNLIRFGTPALSDVAEALAIPLELPPKAALSTPMGFTRKIEVSGLGFNYPGFDQTALSDVSIEIARGEIIAFVGASGSGKTTMANLLLGILQPTRGDILIDDVPMTVHVAAWRAKVAFVPQDVFLLNETLRRNIAFGQEDAKIDDAALSRAVQLAQLESLIDELPEGLNTRIGDRGGRLSGGQRLRVAIARALYFGREVLVLDEATSALDPRTEREITNAIDGLRGKVTVIIVAHRMSTVQHCDRLYVFSRGQIAACGSFDLLSRESVEFRSLIGLPSGLEISPQSI
ncbi:MAG: ABC transporter ATP-binding protein [Pseudomonadota bacterium]